MVQGVRSVGSFSRFARGIGANAVAQIVNTIIAVVMVPLLVSKWGVGVYANWILLSTIPTYLALSGVGVATAAGSDMAMSHARGDRDLASETFSTALNAVIILGTAVVWIAILTIICLDDKALTGLIVDNLQNTKCVIIVLMSYSVMSQVTVVLLNAFRASGYYSTGTLLNVVLTTTEGMGVFVVVMFGIRPVGVAFMYLILRAVGNCGMYFVLLRRVPWCKYRAVMRFGEIRRLFWPAVSISALPLGDALILQGTLIAIGAVAPKQAVVIFSTVRTLCRVCLQLTMMVSNSALPEMSLAAGTRDRVAMDRIVLFNNMAVAVILVPSIAVVATIGPALVSIWTRHIVAASQPFVLAMALATLLNGVWQAMANLLIAINKQGGYSYTYAIVSALNIPATWLLTMHWNLAGAAAGAVLGNLAVLWSVGRASTKVGLLSGRHIGQFLQMSSGGVFVKEEIDRGSS